MSLRDDPPERHRLHRQLDVRDADDALLLPEFPKGRVVRWDDPDVDRASLEGHDSDERQRDAVMDRSHAQWLAAGRLSAAEDVVVPDLRSSAAAGT
jgi:hypothetical protein